MSAGTLSQRELLTCQYIAGTIQGEGKFCGEPSVFVRTALCNLHCSWCDTGYSWQAGFRRRWQPLSFEALERMAPPRARRWGLVVTGGEPLLWQDHPQFRALVNFGLGRFKRVTVETNGTIAPRAYLRAAAGEPGSSSRGAAAENGELWFSVSPKLANSGEPLRRRRHPEALSALSGLPQSYFKFVVGHADEDREILDTYGGIPPEKIFVMPEGATPRRLAETTPAALAMALRNGWHLSLRAHIMLNVE